MKYCNNKFSIILKLLKNKNYKTFFIILDNQSSTILGNRVGTYDNYTNDLLIKTHMKFFEHNIKFQFIWARRDTMTVVLADAVSKLLTCPFDCMNWKKEFINMIKNNKYNWCFTQEITTYEFWKYKFHNFDQEIEHKLKEKRGLFILPHNKNEISRLIRLLKYKKWQGTIIGPLFENQHWMLYFKKITIFKWKNALQNPPPKSNHYRGFISNFNFR